MPQTVRVDQSVVTAAYDNFVRLFHPGQQGMGLHFWNFLKADYHLPLHGPEWEMDEKGANRVRMLAGPYYEVYARMLELNGHKSKLDNEP